MAKIQKIFNISFVLNKKVLILFNTMNKMNKIKISGTSFFYNSDSNWISETGTDASVTSRTLKVQDRDAYDALVTKGLPANWKIGSNCTVLDKDGNVITE